MISLENNQRSATASHYIIVHNDMDLGIDDSGKKKLRSDEEATNFKL